MVGQVVWVEGGWLQGAVGCYVALQQIVAEAAFCASQCDGNFSVAQLPNAPPTINSTEKNMDELSSLGMVFTGLILVLAVTMAIKLASRKAYH